MPTFTEQGVKGYAHCRDARCPGYNQERVDAIREEKSFTFGESGGDGVFTHMIEKSMVAYAFVNDEDVPCPACGKPREVSGQARPSYQPLSGHDPMGLLRVPKFDALEQGSVPPAGHEETDEEMELRLRAEIKQERMKKRLRAEIPEDD